MNNLESIDKYLVSEIDEMETTPSDQVWNSIDAKLQAKKAARSSRTKNFKILGAAAALTIATALVITYSNSNEQKQSTPSVITENKNETASQKNSHTSHETTVSAETVRSADNSAPSKEVTSSGNKTLATDIVSINNNSTVKNEQNTALGSGKEEAPDRTRPVTSVVNESKKDNSDKDIILLPYFAPGYAGTSATQTNKATPPGPSVNTIKNDQAETPKSEPKENTVYMPNAFTPNGDGLNDVFLPQTAETPGEYKLSVFDRAGNLVFYSDDIQKGWDGRTNHNGMEEVKEDVYIWRIEMKTIKGEKRHLMGSLTLLK